MQKTIKCDLHIHSNYSDGKYSIREIVDLYGKKGFGAIAITDHLCETENIIGKFSHTFNYSLSKNSFNDYMKEIKEEAERAAKLYDLLLIPGYEITKNSFVNHRSAHILILGTEEFISPELEVDQILLQAKKHSAFTVAAHPFHTGEFEFQTFHLWSRKEQLNDLIDAWEVNTRKQINSEVLNSGLPLIANSDLHNLKHFNSWKTKVYSRHNLKDIFNSIKMQKVDFFLDSQTLAI